MVHDFWLPERISFTYIFRLLEEIVKFRKKTSISGKKVNVFVKKRGVFAEKTGIYVRNGHFCAKIAAFSP